MNKVPSHVFRPHGKVETWVDGQFLLTEVTGPWNVELVEYWAHQALKLAMQFSAEMPYVSILIVHESMLCPADALKRIAAGIEYAKNHLACLGHCVVADHGVDGRDIVRSIYEKIHLEQIFETLEEAKAWASKLLQENHNDLN